MRNQYYLWSCCGTRSNGGGRGNGCRRPNCLITLSGQCGSTAISYTMTAVVIHNPWFSVHAEDRPRGARLATAPTLYGSHTTSSGDNRSKSQTYAWYARLTWTCAHVLCRFVNIREWYKILLSK